VRAIAATLVAATLVAAAAIAGSSLAAVPLPPQSAGVSESTSTAGARPVALTFILRYQMQCGNPGKGPVTLTLPSAMTVPAKIAKSSVLLNGKTPPSVTSRGTKIVVGIAQPSFVTCDVIGVGKLTIVLKRSAGIGNPKTKGVYTFNVQVGKFIKGQPLMRVT
jgi:hypothetical protein